MRLLFSLIIVVLVTATAVAQKVVVIDASNTPPGKYYYQVIVTESGVTVIPLSQVIRPASPITPVDPVNPTGTKARVLVLTKAAIANGGSATTAKGLSALYKIVAKSFADGSVDATKVRNAIKLATGAVLREGKQANKWKAWTVGTNKIMEGNITPQTLYDISAGLEDGAGAEKALFDNIDITKLLEIIFTILKLLGIGV